MYAVIRTGGKQYKVEQGTTLNVERLNSEGDELTFAPILLVDGDRVLSSAGDLANVAVSARIVGEAKGPKITGFRYKNKSNQRKRWGHRQKYDTVEITAINL
jgi:large subunit ribosomal protein L21